VCSNDIQKSNDCNEVDFQSFLNGLAKHVALLQLKITESYMLPKSIANSIFQDIQTLFDIHQMELSKLLNCRIQKIGVSVSDDLILQQFISTNSVFQTVQNKCSTDNLFNKYLTDYLDLNSPIKQFIGIPSAAPYS